MGKKKAVKMWVPVEFKQFVLRQRAEEPETFTTNYDVLDDLINDPFSDRSIKKRKKNGPLFGRF